MERPKEVLDWARRHYETASAEEKAHWEFVFPELKESEDESEDFEDNIRNLLHDKLTGHSEDGSISWATFIDDKTLKDIVNGIWFYVEKEAYKYPNKELKTEQKPAEWSDAKERVFKDICKHLKEEGYGGWVLLLNALRNGEFQPKPEWSEEDKDYYDTIVRKLEVIGDDCGLSSNQIKFLRDHCPLYRSEWSEEYREEDLRIRFAFYTYKDEDDALYLSNVFVEEASRHKGFGTKILKAAEKVAEIIGASRICLKVKQNTTANDWYRRHEYGYVTFEDGYDWLEKRLEYLKPKQEWSEEDRE